MMCASALPPFSRRYSGLFHFTAHVQKLLREAAPKQTEWRRVQTTTVRRSYHSGGKKRSKREENRKVVAKLLNVTIFFTAAIIDDNMSNQQ